MMSDHQERISQLALLRFRAQVSYEKHQYTKRAFDLTRDFIEQGYRWVYEEGRGELHTDYDGERLRAYVMVWRQPTSWYGASVQYCALDFDWTDQRAVMWVTRKLLELRALLDDDCELMLSARYSSILGVALGAGFGIDSVVLLGDPRRSLERLCERYDPPQSLGHLNLRIKPLTTMREVEHLISLKRDYFTAHPEFCWFGAHEEHLKLHRAELERSVMSAQARGRTRLRPPSTQRKREQGTRAWGERGLTERAVSLNSEPRTELSVHTRDETSAVRREARLRVNSESAKTIKRDSSIGPHREASSGIDPKLNLDTRFERDLVTAPEGDLEKSLEKDPETSLEKSSKTNLEKSLEKSSKTNLEKSLEKSSKTNLETNLETGHGASLETSDHLPDQEPSSGSNVWVIYRGHTFLGNFSYEVQSSSAHWGHSAGLDIMLHPLIQRQGVVKTVYRVMLESMLERGVDVYKGGTAQPAVMGLGKLMERPLFSWVLRKQVAFAPQHFAPYLPEHPPASNRRTLKTDI